MQALLAATAEIHVAQKSGLAKLIRTLAYICRIKCVCSTRLQRSLYAGKYSYAVLTIVPRDVGRLLLGTGKAKVELLLDIQLE